MKNLLSLFQNIYVVHYLRTGFTLIFCLSLSDTLKSEKLASNLNVYVHIYDYTMTCIYTVCNLQCITFRQHLKVRSHPGIWICTGYAPLDAIRICPPVVDCPTQLAMFHNKYKMEHSRAICYSLTDPSEFRAFQPYIPNQNLAKPYLTYPTYLTYLPDLPT